MQAVIFFNCHIPVKNARYIQIRIIYIIALFQKWLFQTLNNDAYSNTQHNIAKWKNVFHSLYFYLSRSVKTNIKRMLEFAQSLKKIST